VGRRVSASSGEMGVGDGEERWRKWRVHITKV